MGKIVTTDALTNEGRRFFGAVAALKTKPAVKVGVLSRDFGKPKDAYDSEEKGQATLGEIAIYAEFGTATEPERAFIRLTVETNRKKWAEFAKELKTKIIQGMDVDKALGVMGARIQADMQKEIRSSIPPPNAPATIAAKGGKTKTLIATGQLVNSIAWELMRGET